MFHSRRSLSRIRILSFNGYSLMIYSGALVGLIVENYLSNQLRLNSLRVFVVTLVLFAVALLSARMFFVATHWRLYHGNIGSIIDRKTGGMTLYGGLPAIALSWILLPPMSIPIGSFADLAAVGILTGMIIGRLGCMLQGCCGGRPTTSWFGLYLPNLEGIWSRRIPTQIIEACWATILLAIAVPIWGYHLFPGFLFVYALAGYAAGRFVLEGTREHQDLIGRIRLQRALSIILMLVSALIVFLELTGIYR